MLLAEPKLSRALPFESISQAEAFFERLRTLRNRIAHSDAMLEELATPEVFNQVLSQLRHVTDLVSALASEALDSRPGVSSC